MTLNQKTLSLKAISLKRNDEYFDIKGKIVYKWIGKKDLTGNRIGKPSKFKLAEIDELVNRREL
jgi:hypothetical protein